MLFCNLNPASRCSSSREPPAAPSRVRASLKQAPAAKAQSAGQTLGSALTQPVPLLLGKGAKRRKQSTVLLTLPSWDAPGVLLLLGAACLHPRVKGSGSLCPPCPPAALHGEEKHPPKT